MITIVKIRQWLLGSQSGGLMDAIESDESRINAILAERDAEIERLREAFPRCNGEWLSGSGGHRMHSGDCKRIATYWRIDDSNAYCDAHIQQHEKRDDYEAPWADEIRELDGGP